MLRELTIENVAIIESADLRLHPGLNILTGETGAGKSIILDSINMVLGQRTSREILRTGAPRAEVTAVFTDCGERLGEMLRELEIDEEELTRLQQAKLRCVKELVARQWPLAAIDELYDEMEKIFG